MTTFVKLNIISFEIKETESTPEGDVEFVRHFGRW